MSTRALFGGALAALVAIVLSGALEGLAATPNPCATAQPAVTRQLTLDVNGSPREVLLHAPRASAGAPQALLVALPGAGGRGRYMQASTGLSAIADRDGFVVAYADPLHGRWAIHTAGARGSGDIAFVSRVIDVVSRARCISPRHVWLIGVSNGAGEAARASCPLAGRVSAAVLVAGVYRRLPACGRARPVSVLEIHSTGDRVAPYRRAGGVPAFLAAWRLRDGCRRPGTHRRLGPAEVQAAWTCAQGTRVAQLRLAGIRHGWPGTLAGGGSASAAAVAFLRALPPRSLAGG